MAIVLKWTLQCMFYIYLFIATFSIPPSRAGNNSLIPNGTVCVCPGDEVIYTCSILGGATTLWSGTALDCRPGDITLLHSDPFRPETFSYCGGNITSEIVGRVEDCYISRLKVAAIAKFNNTSVDCSLQDPDIMSIGMSAIYIIPASDLLREPRRVMVSSLNMTEITMSLIEVNSPCSGSINYNFNSSNCDSVACITTGNEVTCSNLPIGSMCTFNIRSAVCDQMQNNAITVTLRRPQANITPVYSPGSLSTLIKVIITLYQEPFLSVAGDGPSPVIGYSFSYSDTNVNLPACQENEVVCQHSIDITCPPSAEIDATLSASNMLGRGPATNPTTIGCANEFVRVVYDSSTSTIICNFLDETDFSIKSCSLRQCDQMLASSPEQNSTVEAPNSITLNMATEDSDCFLVTASGSSFRVTVEVRTSVGTGNTNTRATVGIIVGVVVGVIMVLIIIIIILVVIVHIVMVKSKRTPTTEEALQLTASDVQLPWKEIKPFGEFRRVQEPKADEIVERFQLQEVPNVDVKVIDIYKDYELKELAEEVNSEWKTRVGRSFCLFEGELEDIPEQKNIYFLHEITSKLFFVSNVTSLKQNRTIGDRIASLKKVFEGYKIFVETDDKNLKAQTSILYEIQTTQSNPEAAAESSTEVRGATSDNSRGASIGDSTNGIDNIKGTASDNPRGAIAGASTNEGSTGGAPKDIDANKSNTENDTEVTPV